MKILNIFAHFDDAEIWAGGTLLKHAERGDKIFTLVHATKRHTKYKESAKAHTYFNGTLVTMPNMSVQILERYITKLQPDIIITHRPDDSNPEHREIFSLVSNATLMPWIKKHTPKQLFVVDSYSSRGLHGIFSPSVYINISDVWAKKEKIIKEFKSEPTDMWITMCKKQNAFWGEGTMQKYCEVFKQIPIQGKLTADEYLC